jgi:hypothetical protein
MPVTRILLNEPGGSSAEIEKDIRTELAAIETIKVTETKEPAPAGTLVPGLEHVAAFVISHGDKIIGLATALINLLNTILSKRGMPSPASKPTAIQATLVIEDKELSFPSSAAHQERFLKSLESAQKTEK